MTRAEAKTKLIALGITEPTEEQVTQYLDTISDETKSERTRADKYKADADKAKSLQTKIDELEAGQLSEIEKANKALESANNKIAELEKKDTIRTKRANAVSKWKITSEQAEQIYGDDGGFNDDLLGQIISEKETAAANAKEQEIAKNSQNPGGGNGGSNGNTDEKTADVKNAESITFGGLSNNAQSARDYYK